jgi:hypothetical protein
LTCGLGEEITKANGRKTLKENQGEESLYKGKEANPSRGENPENKFWSSRMGVGQRARNPIQETRILL